MHISCFMILFLWVLFTHTAMNCIVSSLCHFKSIIFFRECQGQLNWWILCPWGHFCRQIIASLVSVHVQGNTVPPLWWTIKVLHNSSHEYPFFSSSSSSFSIQDRNTLPERTEWLNAECVFDEGDVDCVADAVCAVWEVLLPFQHVSAGASDSNFVWLSKVERSKSVEGKIGWRPYS